MFRKVAGVLLIKLVTLLSIGSPLHKSDIMSKEGSCCSFSITIRVTIDMVAKCRVSNYFLKKDDESPFRLIAK